MKASFAILSVTAFVLMCVTFVVGMAASGATPAVQAAEPSPIVMRHFLLGLMAVLFTCFVHALAFTYFIVHVRMARDAHDTAGMSADALKRVYRLQRASIRALMLGASSAIAAGAAGAWLLGGRESTALTPHFWIATICLLCNAWSFRRQYLLIVENTALTDTIYDRLPQPTVRSNRHTTP